MKALIWLSIPALIASGALLVSQAQRARTPIPFWHSMAGAEKTVAALTDGFNRSQDAYTVTPKMVGSYPEANTQLIAALRAKNAPVIFQAEIGFFPRLAEDGVLADMAAFEKTLEPAVAKDFFPALWNYGVFDGKRYGLPWNASTPVLFFNASQFRAKGLKPPTTWPEFASVSKALSNRNAKGFLAIADSWQFEQMVLSRGGNVVTNDGKPNFTSKEAVSALEFLRDQVKSGHAIPRKIGRAHV